MATRSGATGGGDRLSFPPSFEPIGHPKVSRTDGGGTVTPGGVGRKGRRLSAFLHIIRLPAFPNSFSPKPCKTDEGHGPKWLRLPREGDKSVNASRSWNLFDECRRPCNCLAFAQGGSSALRGLFNRHVLALEIAGFFQASENGTVTFPNSSLAD